LDLYLLAIFYTFSILILLHTQAPSIRSPIYNTCSESRERTMSPYVALFMDSTVLPDVGSLLPIPPWIPPKALDAALLAGSAPTFTGTALVSAATVGVAKTTEEREAEEGAEETEEGAEEEGAEEGTEGGRGTEV
jgi:hypothetical protein